VVLAVDGLPASRQHRVTYVLIYIIKCGKVYLSSGGSSIGRVDYHQSSAVRCVVGLRIQPEYCTNPATQYGGLKTDFVTSQSSECRLPYVRQ